MIIVKEYRSQKPEFRRCKPTTLFSILHSEFWLLDFGFINLYKKHIRQFISCVALALLSCPGILFAAPDFPAPPKARIGKITNNMVINGILMDVRQFTSNKSVESVLQFYREFWPRGTEEQPGYTETDALEPWQMITRVEDGYLMTVQVTHSGDNGSTGLLGMSKLPNLENLPKLGKDFPKMNGSYVANDIVTKDPGKKGRTLQLSNHFSVENNANFYRDHYVNQGYNIDIDKSVRGGDSHAQRFSRGNKNVILVISKSPKGKGTVVAAQLEN